MLSMDNFRGSLPDLSKKHVTYLLVIVCVCVLAAGSIFAPLLTAKVAAVRATENAVLTITDVLQNHETFRYFQDGGFFSKYTGGDTQLDWDDGPEYRFFYLFEVSNPKAVVAEGQRPYLVQRGPFPYRKRQKRSLQSLSNMLDSEEEFLKLRRYGPASWHVNYTERRSNDLSFVDAFYYEKVPPQECTRLSKVLQLPQIAVCEDHASSFTMLNLPLLRRAHKMGYHHFIGKLGQRIFRELKDSLTSLDSLDSMLYNARFWILPQMFSSIVLKRRIFLLPKVLSRITSYLGDSASSSLTGSAHIDCGPDISNLLSSTCPFGTMYAISLMEDVFYDELLAVGGSENQAKLSASQAQYLLNCTVELAASMSTSTGTGCLTMWENEGENDTIQGLSLWYAASAFAKGNTTLWLELNTLETANSPDDILYQREYETLVALMCAWDGINITSAAALDIILCHVKVRGVIAYLFGHKQPTDADGYAGWMNDRITKLESMRDWTTPDNFTEGVTDLTPCGHGEHIGRQNYSARAWNCAWRLNSFKSTYDAESRMEAFDTDVSVAIAERLLDERYSNLNFGVAQEYILSFLNEFSFPVLWSPAVRYCEKVYPFAKFTSTPAGVFPFIQAQSCAAARDERELVEELLPLQLALIDGVSSDLLTNNATIYHTYLAKVCKIASYLKHWTMDSIWTDHSLLREMEVYQPEIFEETVSSFLTTHALTRELTEGTREFQDRLMQDVGYAQWAMASYTRSKYETSSLAGLVKTSGRATKPNAMVPEIVELGTHIQNGNFSAETPMSLQESRVLLDLLSNDTTSIDLDGKTRGAWLVEQLVTVAEPFYYAVSDVDTPLPDPMSARFNVSDNFPELGQLLERTYETDDQDGSNTTVMLGHLIVSFLESLLFRRFFLGTGISCTDRDRCKYNDGGLFIKSSAEAMLFDGYPESLLSYELDLDLQHIGLRLTCDILESNASLGLIDDSPLGKVFFDPVECPAVTNFRDCTNQQLAIRRYNASLGDTEESFEANVPIRISKDETPINWFEGRIALQKSCMNKPGTNASYCSHSELRLPVEAIFAGQSWSNFSWQEKKACELATGREDASVLTSRVTTGLDSPAQAFKLDTFCGMAVPSSHPESLLHNASEVPLNSCIDGSLRGFAINPLLSQAFFQIDPTAKPMQFWREALRPMTYTHKGPKTISYSLEDFDASLNLSSLPYFGEMGKANRELVVDIAVDQYCITEQDWEGAKALTIQSDKAPIGLLNLSSLESAPIYLGSPHHLYNRMWGGTEYAEIDNLSPDPDAHGNCLDIETYSGTSIKQTRRVQVNFEIHRDILFPSLMSRLHINEISGEVEGVKSVPIYFPVLWFEEARSPTTTFFRFYTELVLLANGVTRKYVSWSLGGSLCALVLSMLLLWKKEVFRTLRSN